MAHHVITTPVSEETIRSWQVNDTIALHGTLFGIRDAIQIHMFDRGRTTRFNLNGCAVIHTAPNVRQVENSDEYPAGYALVCMTPPPARAWNVSRVRLWSNMVRT